VDPEGKRAAEGCFLLHDAAEGGAEILLSKFHQFFTNVNKILLNFKLLGDSQM